MSKIINPNITSRQIANAFKEYVAGTNNPGICLACGKESPADMEATDDHCPRCNTLSLYGPLMLGRLCNYLEAKEEAH